MEAGFHVGEWHLLLAARQPSSRRTLQLSLTSAWVMADGWGIAHRGPGKGHGPRWRPFWHGSGVLAAAVIAQVSLAVGLDL
jgi:steroid 5-alpha reductase family enzyme